MARPSVPQFGEWDGNVPYTACFEDARNNKVVGKKMINPNDPSENPDMFRNMHPTPLAPAPAPAPATPSRSRRDPPIGRGAVRPMDGGSDFRQFSNSSTRSQNPGPRHITESNYGGRGGPQKSARSSRLSSGSDQSFDNHLPLHPVGRGGGGPPLARDGRNNKSAHSTPSRHRPTPSRVEESPEVPKFGDWTAPENYTLMFDYVSKPKNSVTGNNAPATPKRTPYRNVVPRNKPAHKSKKYGCCPWW